MVILYLFKPTGNQNFSVVTLFSWISLTLSFKKCPFAFHIFFILASFKTWFWNLARYKSVARLLFVRLGSVRLKFKKCASTLGLKRCFFLRSKEKLCYGGLNKTLFLRKKRSRCRNKINQPNNRRSWWLKQHNKWIYLWHTKCRISSCQWWWWIGG